MSASRTVMSWLLALAAGVLIPLSIVSVWVSAHVEDTDRYVETVGPLARDSAVERAVVDRVTLVALDGLGMSERTGPVARRVSAVVSEAVTAAVRSDAFGQVWITANRAVHRQAHDALTNPDSRLVSAQGDLVLGLSAVLTPVWEALDGRGLLPGGRAPDLAPSITLVKAEDLQTARTVYRVTDLLSSWLPILAGVAVLGALLVSPRRLGTAILLALSTAAGLGLTFVVVQVARRGLLATTQERDTAVVAAVWDALISSLHSQLAIAAAASAVLFVVSLGARALRSR